MAKAARAIIIENDKILVMHRLKEGTEYFTLVGGRVHENESVEQALIREVKEETGFDVVRSQPVFYEAHSAPYNEQYIYLCEIGPHGQVAIQDTSEEALMNRVDINIHTPYWAETVSFSKLPFRTPQLQNAIVRSLKTGFPRELTKI